MLAEEHMLGMRSETLYDQQDLGQKHVCDAQERAQLSCVKLRMRSKGPDARIGYGEDDGPVLLSRTSLSHLAWME